MAVFAERSKCTGCTACVSACPVQCIEMKPDDYGFLYPEVPDPTACTECGECERVCPVTNRQPEGRTQPQAYAAINPDENVRMDSSSGGVFSKLAEAVLGKGGVVYGAAYDDSFAVKHICVEQMKDLLKLRGAKYAQSRLEGIFPEIENRLKSGQYVLFSGTPCQVAGLKAFLSGDYPNLLCVDFVCHSVPSPGAWQAFVAYRAETDAEGALPAEINLRSKSTGWSRYRYSNLFRYQNGAKYSALSSQSLYMKLFVGDYICRSSCGECIFKGFSRSSDITLGDFWGIWDIAPEMDDNKGTSVVLIQSETGARFWNEIRDGIRIKAVTLEEACRNNPSMIKASPANPGREQALKNICSGNIQACEQFFAPPSGSFLRSVRKKIRSLLKAK